jgi:hypothetical protein
MTYVRRTPHSEIAANSKPDPVPNVDINQVLPDSKTQQNSDANQSAR